MCKKHKQFHDMLIHSVMKEFHVEEYPKCCVPCRHL
jgi:hypothetical protein